MTPEFWQRLLAADTSAAKSRALLEALGSSPDDPLHGLLSSSLLTDKERDKARNADIAAMERAIAQGVRVVTGDDYPEPLGSADFAPPALFVDGEYGCVHAPTIAIVGTRNASTYGRACAQKFAQAFARAGVTVVSGGALGIDGAAHKGALEGEGATLAVLAGGVDNVYPSVHAGLFRQIKERGCLVSQFAVGSKPNEYKFLVRNSLVAMLSLAVLVVEAPHKSGALHTADAAAELGREVFVVPANIDNWNFHGSFHLIRQGATLVDNPIQVLEALGIEPAPALPPAPPPSSLSEQILAVLSVDPIPTEVIVDRTGIPAAELLAELTMLELDGRVIRASTGYATRP